MAGIFLTQINRICNLYILLDNALTIGIKNLFSIAKLPFKSIKILVLATKNIEQPL